jgi:outer membrane lipoprotein SlyB
MKFKNLTLLVLAAAVTAPTVMADTAMARDYYYSHGRKVYYSRARVDCREGNGAVGTVAGGVGGALIGSAVGGGVAGPLIGGVGGALLGRHLDKVNTRHKHGCYRR